MNRTSLTLRLAFSSLVLACASHLQADDWPQWGGRNRDGKSAETGLLKQWPAEGPKLAWKATGFGGGYSSIAVAAGRLYTMGDKDGSDCLIAASADSGKVLWSTKVGAAGAPSVPGYDFPGPRCTPTVDGGKIAALDAWGQLICLNTADGKELWRRDLVKDFGGTPPTWGYSESVLMDGDQVVATPGGPKGTLVAVNKNTGEVIWQSAALTDPAGYSSVVPAEIGGVHQYVQLTPDSVAGFSPKDGSVLWKTTRHGNIAVIPTPLVAGNEVYVTSGYGAGCNMFKITETDGKFGAQNVFANHVIVNHHGGVVWVGDEIFGYSDGKGLSCQDAKSGQAAWAEKDKVKKGAVIYADGRLYVREEDTGTVVLVEAAPGGYKEDGRLKQPDRTADKAWSHPAIANRKLFLRDQGSLFCYDIKAD